MLGVRYMGGETRARGYGELRTIALHGCGSALFTTRFFLCELLCRSLGHSADPPWPSLHFMQLRSGGLLLLLAVAQAIQYFPTQDAVDLCANVDLEESSVSNVDDSPAETVLLPFMFPFFGSLYERVFLNPNGAVQLDASVRGSGHRGESAASRTVPAAVRRLFRRRLLFAGHDLLQPRSALSRGSRA